MCVCVWRCVGGGVYLCGVCVCGGYVYRRVQGSVCCGGCMCVCLSMTVGCMLGFVCLCVSLCRGVYM